MASCKNHLNGSETLELKFKNNKHHKTKKLASYIGERSHQLQKEAFFFGKDCLQILSFIIDKPNKTYNCNYWQLKWDFSTEEVRKVAKITKEMCKKDIRAFCILSNYLLKCCLKLQEKRENIASIEKTLMTVLKLLAKENPPNAPLKLSHEIANKHGSYA